MCRVGTTVIEAAMRRTRSSGSSPPNGQWASSVTPASSALAASALPATCAVTPSPCRLAPPTTAASVAGGSVGPTLASSATLITLAPAAASPATASAAPSGPSTSRAVPGGAHAARLG